MHSTRPTPRKQQSRPSGAATAIVCLLVIAALGLFAWWGLTSTMPTEAEQRPAHKITHDSLAPTYTYDGEIIRWYVFIDPDTDVQYLVNDQGGCMPRLDEYGNVMGVQSWYDE